MGILTSIIMRLKPGAAEPILRGNRGIIFYRVATQEMTMNDYGAINLTKAIALTFVGNIHPVRLRFVIVGKFDKRQTMRNVFPGPRRRSKSPDL